MIIYPFVDSCFLIQFFKWKDRLAKNSWQYLSQFVKNWMCKFMDLLEYNISVIVDKLIMTDLGHLNYIFIYYYV